MTNSTVLIADMGILVGIAGEVVSEKDREQGSGVKNRAGSR
jgi:hypothetical protein